MAFKKALAESKKAYEKKKKEEEELKKGVTSSGLVFKAGTSAVPIASSTTRNKDADNLTFTGTLLGGISNFTGAGSLLDKTISDFKNDPTLMAKAKEQGLDTSQLYTTQENLNMFGSDVKRVVEAGGAGLSSALSNLGKGTILFARDMGGATALADKLTNEYRNKSDSELEEIAKKANISTQTLKDYVSKAKTSYENINDFSANTFDKWSNEANQRIVELQGETENDFAKKAIGFMPNISQQAVTIGASLVNPVLGTYVASGQAKGSYFNDAKQRGMTDEQANDFSQIMGIVEGGTEMIGIGKMIKAGKGAKALVKGGLKSARKELSKEVITSTFGNLLGSAMDNFMQEAITEPIQEGVADWIAGKGNWENIDERMLKAGINGAITSLITGGAHIGVQSAVGVASRIKNGQNVTQQEVNQGLVDTLAEIDNLSKEEKQEFIDKYVTPGIQTAQDVVKNEQNQVPIEPNRAVPMQTSENAQQQVQEQEQQVISNQNENALNQNVEPQNLVESAERSGIDVKDENTRKNLEVIQKFNENRGIKATFDADAFKGHDNVNSFFRVDENGNREIVFNPNTMTDKTIQQLAVHEVYHDMVAGGTAQELTDFVIQKMSNNPEYQEYVRALQDVYEEQDSDIIKEEAVAHYLEKNLGTDEFISELQQRGDRTTMQRIIDTIKDMITKAKNTLTGKGDLNYLLDLQRKYEQAYRGEFKGTQEQTKLSKQVNAQDNQGRTLTKEQQDYFKDSKVRDENGKILPVYHSTSSEFNVYDKNKMGQNYGWLEFGDGFYFTPSLETAKDFGEIGLRTGKTNIKEQYLDIENPFNIYKSNDKETINKMALDIENEYNQKNNSNLKISDFKKENGGRFIDFLKNGLNYSDKEIQNILKKYGYDGINAIENKNGEYKGQVVAFEPNQIKNIDNTNPTENVDIRFSKSKDSQGNVTDNLDAKNLSPQEIVDNLDKSKGTLLAIHNLSEEKLNGILELGGFPVPSIAITDPSKVGHGEFGDISVVFDKSTIDPKNKLNEVFDRDVWSPTFPKIEYEANRDTIKNIQKNLDIDKNYQDLDSIQRRAYHELSKDEIERNLNSYSLDTLKEILKDNKYIKYAYLKSNDKINPVIKQVEYNKDVSNDALQNFLEKYPNMTDFAKDTALNELSFEQTQQLSNQIKEIVKKDLEKKFSNYGEYKQELIDKILSSYDNYNKLNDFIYSAVAMERSGENATQIDESSTFDKIDKILNQEEYNKWIDQNITENLIANKGIKNEKELFTPQGNRRSFKATHNEVNLQNIVKALSRKNTKGGQDVSLFGTGFGRISAQTANKFKSIKDIKNNESRLMTREQATEIIQPLSTQLFEKVDELANYYTRKDYGSEMVNHMQGVDVTSEIVEELASGNLTEDRFRNILEEYNSYDVKNIPSELLNGIVEDLNKIKELPTDYFEAKPQRAVGLDEVATIVIPEGRTELKQVLQDRGLDVIEYDPNIEGDRQAKLNELSEYKFSKQGSNESQEIIDNFLEKTKVNEGTGTAIKDLARVPIDYKAKLQPELNKLSDSNKAQMSEIIDTLETNGELNEQNYNSALQTIKDLQETIQEVSQETTPADELSVNLKDGKYGKFDSELRDYRNKYEKGQLDYNKDVVNSAMELVPGKKIQGQQKRTKAEWLRIAQHIGQDITNLSDQQVKDTAYATWLDLAPNNKNTLNREGGKYVDFKSQEWNNAIYDAVKQNRTETTEPVRQVAPSEAPAQVPQVNEAKQRQVEPIRDITDVQRPQVPQNQKTRKTYESIINSNQMTQEAKQIARELMGYDTYVPQTNKFTLEQADRNIEQNGVDESLTTLTNKINNNNKVDAIDIATGERLIEYYSKIGDRQKLQEAIQSTAMAGTEAGRAVQAMSMINHQTPIGQVTWIQRSVDKVNKRLAKEGRKAQFNFTPEMQQKILNSTSENLQQNLNEVYQELGKQVPKSNMEKFNEWRYFSMLANPKTHIRNILGNTVMKAVQNMKNKVAGTIEDFVIGDNAERWNSLKGASKGMYEFAKNDLKNADVQSMLGLNENKYNPQSRLQQNQRTFKSDLLENTLGKLFGLNSKALEVEDGWGLKSGYAKAMTNYLNANNLDYNNLTDAQLQKARNYAVQQAKEATFHQDNTVANMLQTLENKNLFSKIALGGAIPFKKTPMNVALTGFEYSPAGFAKTLTTDLVNLRKGKISANQFIDNISKNLTGTAITLVGYGLTQAGILKASGSGDEDKDEFEEATGKQNYSIQIGDKTYSLDWLTPAGIPLFIGSELYQVSHQKEDGNKTKNENEAFKSITKILDATASAMNPMSEMTMISGLTNALKSYAQGSTKSIENMLANVGKSYATQAVPTALGQIARSTDQYERSTTSTETDPMAKAIDSAKNQIISKIPGLRETLPVSTDVWGNERETQSYEENAILPWTSKEISKDPVNKALTDLYDATGESGVLPDNYIDKSLTIDKEKYKLTNEEYARLKQQYGKTAHDILSDLTKSKEYEQMSDEQKVKAVKEAYSYAKSTLTVTYSDENNLDAEESSTYKKVQSVIDNGGDAKEYFEYTGLIDGVKKEKEKRQILLNSNIKDKGAIYESTIGSDDETYQIMKATGIDPDAYLEYKQQDFSSDKEDDGTVNGKTVSGSGKTKFYDYMDTADMTYEQKLLLTGMKYKLLPGERDTLANYIDTLPISALEKTDIYKKLKGATVYQNGEIYY